MNKTLKRVLIAGACVALPEAVNRLIFHKADKRLRALRMEETEWYQWRFCRVRYTVRGQGAPVLLVHDAAAGHSLLEWSACVQSLARRYTVYALDLPGFGRSEKPNMTYSAYLYVSLLNDFVREIIGQPVNLVGCGRSGTYAALACAFAPSHYANLILVSPVSLDETSVSRRWFGRLLALPIFGTAAYNIMVSRCRLSETLRTAFPNDKAALRSMADQYYLMAHAGGPSARWAAGAGVAGLLDAPLGHVLPRLAVPTQVIEDAGPMPHIENPGGFYQRCKTFFG